MPVFLRVAALLCAAVLAAALIQSDPSSLHFVDDYGRVRVFHGVNVVVKEAPYLPVLDHFDAVYSLSTEDMDNLQKWGMNIVRLGVMWPGVEPASGEFNQTYLDAVQTIINQLGQRGIMTIIDFHQDLMTSWFCGEGMPDWAFEKPDTKAFAKPVIDDDLATDADGKPTSTECHKKSFFDLYFTYAVSALFQNFYENKNGIQDKFIAYWVRLAMEFGANDYVFGYEFLNEPFCGDFYTYPSLLVPGQAGEKYLEPLHIKIMDAIKSFDHGRLVLFERPTTNVIGATGFSTGGPGGMDNAHRNAYSFHNYCGTNDANGDPKSVFLCKIEQWAQWEIDMANLKNMKVPAIMTEFGAVTDSSNAVAMLKWSAGTADDSFISWNYWPFKFFGDKTTTGSKNEGFYDIDGTLQTAKLGALVRPYASAIAGTPDSMGFDYDNRKFTLKYYINSTSVVPTEIMTPPLVYPSGFSVSLSPSGIASWTASSDGLKILVAPTKVLTSKTELTVTITSK